MNNRYNSFQIDGVMNNDVFGLTANGSGSWRSVGGGGIAGDFMRPFTKDFWNRKAARRRARTLEVLRTYGDSITARRKETIIK